MFYICTCPVLGSYPNELQTVYCCRLTISGYWVASFPFWYRIIYYPNDMVPVFSSRQTRDCSSPDLNGVLASSNCFRLVQTRHAERAEIEAKELILDDNKHKTGQSHIGLNLGLERTAAQNRRELLPPWSKTRTLRKRFIFPTRILILFVSKITSWGNNSTVVI